MDITTVLNNLVEQLSYRPQSPMLFSSGLFWALFLLFLPIYGLIKNSHTKISLFVIAFSLFFY